MLDMLNMPQVSFFIILVVAFALLLTERLRNDLVGVLIILALAITGVLTPEEALQGFSSEPAIVVAAIFVLGGALHQTGLSDIFGAWISRLAGSGRVVISMRYAATRNFSCPGWLRRMQFKRRVRPLP